MENASKALLIAAAVLIVIVLIGVSVAILNSTDTSSQVDSVASTQETQAFNAQLTGYLGASRSGNTIPNLLAIVNKINTNNTQHDVAIVELDGDTGKTLINNAKTAVPTEQVQITVKYSVGKDLVSNAKYSITATYDTDGYIYSISIK